jgi:hypothetical protein
MKTKLTKTAENFLRYYFKGNGIYHTTSYGSRRYSQTDYAKFAKANADCVEVVSKGNDAPRGGRIGDFEEANFTPVFFEKYGWFIEQLENEKKAEELREQRKKDEYEKGVVAFREYCERNPERVAEMKEKVTIGNYRKRRMAKTNCVNHAIKTNVWNAYQIFDAVL